MSKLTVEMSDSLRRSIEALAEQEGYSVDQFLASAAAEKMAALRTLAYLRQQGAAGRREDFDRFLAAVPDQEPAETDRLPESNGRLADRGRINVHETWELEYWSKELGVSPEQLMAAVRKVGVMVPDVRKQLAGG